MDDDLQLQSEPRYKKTTISISIDEETLTRARKGIAGSGVTLREVIRVILLRIGAADAKPVTLSPQERFLLTEQRNFKRHQTAMRRKHQNLRVYDLPPIPDVPLTVEIVPEPPPAISYLPLDPLVDPEPFRARVASRPRRPRTPPAPTKPTHYLARTSTRLSRPS